MTMEFLDVRESLSNQKWVGPSSKVEREAAGLVQKHDISFLTALLLAKRGVKSCSIDTFLSPKIRDSMPDPYSLKDMQKGSERLLLAIKKQEKICIFADYDVDGTTSASMILLWLKNFQIFPEIYIPDRIREGYGPNITAMEKLAKNNKVIICVDCGTTAHEAIKIATKNGADVLVLDHHSTGEVLPPAFAVINPKRHDETIDLSYLCAAGVVFLFLVSLGRLLNECKLQAPNMMNFLDLVALATVADVVPLVNLNRALVSQGLKVMGKRNRPGLVALIDEAKIKTQPSSYHVGFILGPRINAAGRISDAKFAVNLLTATTEFEALKIARELTELNTQRRLLENETLVEAIAQIEIQKKRDDNFLWVASNRWHPGIIGIIASRLKEKYKVPSIVFSIDNKGLAYGSARSVLGIDIGLEVRKLAESGILLSGGGHSMAAGLKVSENQLVQSMKRLAQSLNKMKPRKDLSSILHVDSLISIEGATLELVEEMNMIGPFGASNPHPIIAISNCQINNIKVLSSKHIKFNCRDSAGRKLEAIFFNGVETIPGTSLLNNKGQGFHLCGKLDINDWGGYRRVVLQIEDVAAV